MKSTRYLKQAKAKLEAAKGKKSSREERVHSAIDLAALMLRQAKRIQSSKERGFQRELSRMMRDPKGKVFLTEMTDQCFRSKKNKRVANQLTFLIRKYGIPKFLSFPKKVGFFIFKLFGKLFPSFFVSKVRNMVRKETAHVILPGEPEELLQHISERKKENVRVNLNRIGEAILGEEEAQHRLQINLNDLSNPQIEYISVKISTICSQLNLLAWEKTLAILAERLKQIYRETKKQQPPKFVNLDMEEYRDLRLTVELFKHVLSDPEFFDYSAGIVLQSYLPDSFAIQKELTEWALERMRQGGAPIKIRIVKGANLAMEKVEAALRNWPQAPYLSKSDTDANFKQMLEYGFQHADAVHLGIGSHNLFDIAYAMLLRSESNLEKQVSFEMLEGMADAMRRVVQELAGGMLLYCPAAEEEQFQNAIAYLVRRLDENTAPENFLSCSFALTPDSEAWRNQAEQFAAACLAEKNVKTTPNRTQNRMQLDPVCAKCFDNEPDTDWSLPQNRHWIEGVLQEWSQRIIQPVPLVVGGAAVFRSEENGVRNDPSCPKKMLYEYVLAGPPEIETALSSAQEALKDWSKTSVQKRADLLAKVAQGLRRKRGDLIGAMCADSGKPVVEGDVEVSEAIDFAEYYRRSAEEFYSFSDLAWKPKGIVLVTPPWNFPSSIPAGGILASLAAGNVVLFKPAPEAVLVGFELAKIFWEAGVSKKVLQFISCRDEPTGSALVRDPRVAAVVLTGSTATAKLFLNLRPGLDLIAETGGKNAIIVTDLADRDLAIKDIVQSAFGYSGQKCSACSLAILEKEVYDDPQFRKTLRDAAASLHVGAPWDFASKVNPLINPPTGPLKQGLTTLEPGEEWLLEPERDPDNPQLWSPGIKLGVKEGSFTHMTELFGPVLGLMRAENLDHAIQIANAVPYGLTSGLQSLDQREQQTWMQKIVTGNGYINRGITGAIVERQPFGGTKESSFGKGAKAGGPNYVAQLMHAEQVSAPIGAAALPDNVSAIFRKQGLSDSQLETVKTSLANYAFYVREYFSKTHDPMQVLGQDNLLRYVPQQLVTLRLGEEDNLADILRVIGACALTKTPLEVSSSKKLKDRSWLKKNRHMTLIVEEEEAMLERFKKRPVNRVRLLSRPDPDLSKKLAELACRVHADPVLANGRLELLNYLREVVYSIDYHRYGNLGERELKSSVT